MTFNQEKIKQVTASWTPLSTKPFTL